MPPPSLPPPSWLSESVEGLGSFGLLAVGVVLVLGIGVVTRRMTTKKMEPMEPAADDDYVAMESQASPASPDYQKYLMLFYKWSDLTIVDACIAGGAVVATGLILHGADLILGNGVAVNSPFPLFNGSMLTMAIVFFINPSPPPYKVFLQCTLGSWAFGMLLRYLMLESVCVTIIVTGMLLIYFKWAKAMFPPTLGVAIFLITDHTLVPPVGEGPVKFMLYALHWLVTPWLAGSFCFYMVAIQVSKLRAHVHTKLSLLKFAAAFAAKTDAELVDAFNEIDADGSGALDARELIQAWQKATGEVLTVEQAKEKIDEADKNKNGTLDQTEFIAMIRKRHDQGNLRSFADQFSDAKLLDIFQLYDDDGNNEMDTDELVVAWKKATDKRISAAQAEELIKQGAVNGTSTITKEEFVQLVRAHG